MAILGGRGSFFYTRLAVAGLKMYHNTYLRKGGQNVRSYFWSVELLSKKFNRYGMLEPTEYGEPNILRCASLCLYSIFFPYHHHLLQGRKKEQQLSLKETKLANKASIDYFWKVKRSTENYFYWKRTSTKVKWNIFPHILHHVASLLFRLFISQLPSSV